jgi:hypothetical protein
MGCGRDLWGVGEIYRVGSVGLETLGLQRVPILENDKGIRSRSKGTQEVARTAAVSARPVYRSRAYYGVSVRVDNLKV